MVVGRNNGVVRYENEWTFIRATKKGRNNGVVVWWGSTVVSRPITGHNDPGQHSNPASSPGAVAFRLRGKGDAPSA